MTDANGDFVGRLNSEMMKRREISLRNPAVSQKGHEMAPQRLINLLRYRSLSTLGNLSRFRQTCRHLQKIPEFRENNKLIILLRPSIEPAMAPKTCKDFQKDDMISIMVIFFSISQGYFAKSGNFEKGAVFRKNGHLFKILGEYSRKVRFIQKRNSSHKKRLVYKVVGSLQTSSGLYNNQS
jgi:hypothetical protein